MDRSIFLYQISTPTPTPTVTAAPTDAATMAPTMAATAYSLMDTAPTYIPTITTGEASISVVGAFIAALLLVLIYLKFKETFSK